MTSLALVPLRDQRPGSSRYELLVKIAAGATATVFVGRLVGTVGFSRLVAVKRAHPHLVDDVTARRALLAEARLASRIHHANVAAVHDVDDAQGELMLVMDYVEGASLAELLEAAAAAKEPLPPAVAVRIALDAAAGLAAVHELSDDDGQPLGLLHRDVSPQNVLVGLDGTSRITDFGLARLAATEASRTTGTLQGKVAYVAPEIIEGAAADVRSEVFALGVVAWEALAGRRLFRGSNEADTMRRVLTADVPLLSRVAPAVGPHLDAVLARALARDPSVRFASARELCAALEGAARRHDLVGTSFAVGECVRQRVGSELEARKALLRTSVAVASVAAAGVGGETVSMAHAETAAPANDDAPASQPPPRNVARRDETRSSPNPAADDAPTPIAEDAETVALFSTGRRRAVLAALERDEGRRDDLDRESPTPAAPHLAAPVSRSALSSSATTTPVGPPPSRPSMPALSGSAVPAPPSSAPSLSSPHFVPHAPVSVPGPHPGMPAPPISSPVAPGVIDDRVFGDGQRNRDPRTVILAEILAVVAVGVLAIVVVTRGDGADSAPRSVEARRSSAVAAPKPTVPPPASIAAPVEPVVVPASALPARRDDSPPREGSKGASVESKTAEPVDGVPPPNPYKTRRPH